MPFMLPCSSWPLHRALQSADKIRPTDGKITDEQPLKSMVRAGQQSIRDSTCHTPDSLRHKNLEDFCQPPDGFFTDSVPQNYKPILVFVSTAPNIPDRAPATSGRRIGASRPAVRNDHSTRRWGFGQHVIHRLTVPRLDLLYVVFNN